MDLEEFHKELSQLIALRKNREYYANKVLNDLSLLPKLLDIYFLVDDKVSCRAAMVLEIICETHIQYITPYLDAFTDNLHKVRLDSSVRPTAKICSFITGAYYSKKKKQIQRALTSKHKTLITEACFDWLISDQKVAAKVYAMETLYFLGKEQDWIYPELILTIKKDFPNHTAAYKARAKHILKRINKTP